MIETVVYVLDTSALIERPDIINEGKSIILPIEVISELDKLKTKTGTLGMVVRQLSKDLYDKDNVTILSSEDVDEYIQKYNFKVSEKQIKGYVKAYFSIPNQIFEPEPQPEAFNEHYHWSNDDAILNVAYRLLACEGLKVEFISNDNIQKLKLNKLAGKNKNLTISSTSRNYNLDDFVYPGTSTIEVEDDIIDLIYKGQSVFLEDLETDSRFEPNEYLILESKFNKGRKAAAKFVSNEHPLKTLKYSSDKSVWGITPRNIEQNFCLDALLDPQIEVVSMLGRAGSGKTLLAIAAAIQQTFGKGEGERIYSKIIISRPVQPLGNDIGFLPGTMEEKMTPWIQPIMDNLEVIAKEDHVKTWMEKGKIKIEAPTFLRGRTFNKCFIILDEAQNLTSHEIKTILTRVGEGSKIVLTGDIEQIDNPKLDEISNGLTYAINKLKEFNFTSHITLRKGERSRVADIASRLL